MFKVYDRKMEKYIGLFPADEDELFYSLSDYYETMKLKHPSKYTNAFLTENIIDSYFRIERN